MYIAGERGVPLADRAIVERAFQRGALEVTWVSEQEEIPADTNVIVTTGSPVTKDELAKAPKVSLIAVAWSGVDHVDMAACRARGISVVNVPGYSTDATAELAVVLVLSHLRRLPSTFKVIKEGEWASPPQEDLEGKTVGILGTGSLGLRCAQVFNAFKVKSILGYALTQNQTFTAAGGSYTESLAALFLESDIIIICLPLSESTRGLVSSRLMELLRPDSLLVNIGRGSVVDETSLVKFLKERRFRAALDVFTSEPLAAEDPLLGVPEDVLLMTPHVGYKTNASLEKRFDITVKNILAFLAGQAMNVV